MRTSNAMPSIALEAKLILVPGLRGSGEEEAGGRPCGPGPGTRFWGIGGWAASPHLSGLGILRNKGWWGKY